MNCGIFAVNEFLDELNVDPSIKQNINRELLLRLKANGISVYDILVIMNQYGFKMNGYNGSWKNVNLPLILYLPKEKHFMAVLKQNHKVLVSDSNTKRNWIPKWLLNRIEQGVVLCLEHQIN